MAFEVGDRFSTSPPWPQGMETLEEHYNHIVDTLQRWFAKQRDLGHGLEYDLDDRVMIPYSFIWMNT